MLLSLAVWVALAPAPTPAPSGASAAPPKIAQDEGVKRALAVFQLWLEDKARREVIPSVTVAVVHDQELLWAKSLGSADIDRKIAATPQTPYRIASLTKTFTATALLQLRDEGKLQLDDAVQKHLAWFPRKDVTLRHLLTHASGLSRDVPGDDWDTMRFADRSTLPALLTACCATPFGAGERFKYSNLGYAVAGEVVEAVAQKPWADVVTTRILAPLQMTTTRAVAIGTSAAVPYGPMGADGKRAVVDVGAPGWLAAAGGMSSSAEDLARWLSFHMRDDGPVKNGRSDVLARSSVQEMQRAQVVRGDWKGGWGLGWGVVPVEKDTPRVVHAGGADRGSRALVTFDPVKRVGFVVLTNSDAAPREVAEQLWKIVSPAIVKAKTPPIDRASAARLAKYTGRYVKAFVTAEPMLVVVDNDGRGLAFIEGDAAEPWSDRAVLREVGAGTFRFESGDAEGDSVTFEQDAKGNVTRVVGAGWSARKVDDAH